MSATKTTELLPPSISATAATTARSHRGANPPPGESAWSGL